jgi:YHS domain-containing protein
MRHALIAACVLVLLVLGCGQAEVSPPAAAATPAPVSEEARLVAADLADGSEDHVVSKCAVCSLSMDGKPELTSAYAGYTFHHCSAHCKETFDHDPTKVVSRIEPAT